MSNLCFAGLGNPGLQYKAHRHNVGARLIEELCSFLKIELHIHQKSGCLAATYQHKDTKIYFIIPQSYMNESGHPIAQYLHFYKIDPIDLLVFHDDLDFSPGILRFKDAGGHGGHNGLRSLNNHLGITSYKRCRIGIGHPGSKDQVAGYVLSSPNPHDQDIIHKVIDDVKNNWIFFEEKKWDRIIQFFHQKV
jgi:PTH1 family peptidyl-tRNA hydrolase